MRLIKPRGSSSPPGVADAEPCRILFVHIPKTAGMSLFTALERWATPERSLRFPQGGPEDLTAYHALSAERIGELRLLSGHLTLRAFQRRGLAGWSPITLLREPVARTLSLYSSVLENTRHPWHRLVSDMGIERFVDWLSLTPTNIDQQCRFVAGVPDAASAFDALASEFALATTLEHLAGFTDALSRLIATRLRVPRKNRSRAPVRPMEVPAATLDRIRSMNEHDAALYQRVRAAGLLGARSAPREAR